MIRSLILLTSSAFLLSACSALNLTDNSVQELTIVTPGAENTLCYAYIDKFKWIYYPPQMRTVAKSHDPMRIDCKAPGNRDSSVVIEPRLVNSKSSNRLLPDILSQATGNAFYRYPERVEVSFVGELPKPSALPAHNDPSLIQPEDQNLEEYLPGKPLLNSDKNAVNIGAVGSQKETFAVRELPPVPQAARSNVAPIGKAQLNQ